MRVVKAEKIRDIVCELFIAANSALPQDILSSLEKAREEETNERAKAVLSRLIENNSCAKELSLAVCQDTGMAVVFADIGEEVFIDGSFNDAVDQGVEKAYVEGRLRLSVVDDPLYDRKNTKNNTPAVIYTRLVSGDKISITCAPKGFGSENMSAIKMFNPSATEEDVIAFVAETVKKAGANPCPPVVVGVGIGGTFDYAAVLSKKALTLPINEENPDPRYSELERKMLRAINKTGVGTQGFGGDITALGVNILSYPTHIAGLPVAVNIGCHVTRHASAVI